MGDNIIEEEGFIVTKFAGFKEIKYQINAINNLGEWKYVVLTKEQMKKLKKVKI